MGIENKLPGDPIKASEWNELSQGVKAASSAGFGDRPPSRDERFCGRLKTALARATNELTGAKTAILKVFLPKVENRSGNPPPPAELADSKIEITVTNRSKTFSAKTDQFITVHRVNGEWQPLSAAASGVWIYARVIRPYTQGGVTPSDYAVRVLADRTSEDSWVGKLARVYTLGRSNLPAGIELLAHHWGAGPYPGEDNEPQIPDSSVNDSTTIQAPTFHLVELECV